MRTEKEHDHGHPQGHECGHSHPHDHMHSRDHDHGHACCGGDDESLAAGQTHSAGAARLTFKVSGLDCAEEVSILKREIGPLVGGEDKLAFDVLNGRMMVLKDADIVAADDIRQAVGRTGMTAEEWRPGQGRSEADDRHRRLQVWFTCLSGLGVLAGLAVDLHFKLGLGQFLEKRYTSIETFTA